MNRRLEQLMRIRSWLTSGAAWHWYSLATVTLTGLLLVVLFALVVSRGLGYFWPKPVDEWVIQVSKPVSQVTASSGTRKLFARQLEQRRQEITSYSVDDEPVLPAYSNQLLLQFQVFDEGIPDWRYQWFNSEQIIRVTKPRNLLEAGLMDGRRIYGYPLIWVAGREQLEGEELTELIHSGDWRMPIPSQEESDAEIEDTAVAQLVLQLQDGTGFSIPVNQLRQLTYLNNMNWGDRFGRFLHRIWEFLSTGPMPDYQGGILTAIYGTVLLVILMSIILVPLGVVTAVYLHEYSGNSLLTKTLRIAISNLAGIPGIVYGVFVLGVFVYGMGAQLDRWFFSENLPVPTFGAGGLLWASLALALLTLPVVIVATEEGLARIPDDLRRGALALGATRSEMIWGTVVSAASPAILTGLILAIARAAGEVAPLLLVGAVKYTGQPLIEGEFPFLHAERQFMHLGYQVYDFALQSADAHASIPLAYATTLILLALVVLLNLIAIRLRARLRRRFLVDYS